MAVVEEKRNLQRRLRTPALVATTVAVIAGWLIFRPLSAFDSGETEVHTPRATTEVRTADLHESFEADGSIVFLDTRTLLHPTTGTVTAIAEPFTAVSSGDTLYAVDNVPTVALDGQVPAWRTLTVDSVGADVLQLEAALVDLGYDQAGLLNVDGTYTTYTADVVEQWQASLGIEETGTVEHGSVVFIGEAAEVGSVRAVVGQPVPSDGMLDLRDPHRVVTFPVAADDIYTVAVGDNVGAVLPDRTSFDVTITSLQPSTDGSWTITGDPLGLADGANPADEVPVDISWDVAIGDGLVVVPTSAIRRLDSGSYVVEVVRSSGMNDDGVAEVVTEFLPIEVGHKAGSLVEVRSDLEIGTVVIS